MKCVKYGHLSCPYTAIRNEMMLLVVWKFLRLLSSYDQGNYFSILSFIHSNKKRERLTMTSSYGGVIHFNKTKNNTLFFLVASFSVSIVCCRSRTSTDASIGTGILHFNSIHVPCRSINLLVEGCQQ